MLRTLQRFPFRPFRLAPFVLAALLAMLCTAASASSALAADGPAGSVKNAAGTATVTRGLDAPVALKPGDRIFEKDVLITGKESSLGLILRDNTTLALGPGARLVVERFLFEPASGGLAQVLKLTRGSMAAVSGEIVKLNPAVARVETPLATIGIRGTHFLINLEPGLDGPEAKAPGKAAGEVAK